MSEFVHSESKPLSELDLMEIAFLRDLDCRLNSSPKVFNKDLKNRQNSLLIRVFQGHIQRYSRKFPHGSRGRNRARSIVEKLPKFLRSHIISALVPISSNSESSVAISLDLGFGIKTSHEPKVSVVIPVHDGVWVTYRCLRALQRNSDAIPFEIIIVDDASTDQTKDLLASLRGVRIVRNLENQGYLRSTNIGASLARGEFIALLNNDTEPISGWLDDLHRMMIRDSNIAIAGSTLIFGDGRLQESGGQIFDNGNAWNLGRGLDPNMAEFRFTKEVDYCSAAAILVRASFWRQVKGFDERYLPAYCEDSDLALNAWHNGFKVVVSPTSWVIHHEGVSHGTSTSQGIKKYQITNTQKLAEKWKVDLCAHWKDNGVARLESTRNSRGIIVVCDRQAPSQVRDAGSIRTLQLLRHIKQLGYHVVFSAIDFSTNEVELALLEQDGIEIHRSKQSLIHSLRHRKTRLKAFWLIRSEVFDYYVDDLLGIETGIPTVADLIDLNYKHEGKQVLVDRAQSQIAMKATKSLLCSSVESELLKAVFPETNVSDLWAEYEVMELKRTWSDTRGLLFVGGFRHQPNVEALEYFIDSILPIIRIDSPGIEVNVVGTGLTQNHVKLLESNGVCYLGRVDDLQVLYASSRIVIAPLVSGRGRKGKIGEALSFGVPVVTTSVGAEGFNFVNCVDAYVSDDPYTFAKYVNQLEKDPELWEKSSQWAYDYARKNLSKAAFSEKLGVVLSSLIGEQN
jgi:GT2 family glycosyltransferase